MSTECRHDGIVVYVAENGGPDRMWACESCRHRFYPVCPVCVDVGHRDEEHIEAEAVTAALTALRAKVEGLIEAVGGRCIRPDDPEDMICETHSEVLYAFDDGCEDQPRQLLAVLAAIDEALESSPPAASARYSLSSSASAW